MSPFLHNIIYRYQTDDAKLGGISGASSIIQPRPKSRFESNADIGESFIPHDFEIEPTTTSKQSSPSPKITPYHQADAVKAYSTRSDDVNDTTAHFEIEPTTGKQSSSSSKITPYHQADTVRAYSTRSDDVNDATELTNTSTPPLKQKSFAEKSFTQKEPVVRTQDKRNLKIKDQTEWTPETEHKTEQLRIQTILHQLNNPQTQHFDKQSSAEFQQYSAVLNSSITTDLNKNTRAEPEALPFFPEPVLGIEHIEHRGNKKNIANHPQQQAVYQTGLLQTPDWLTEIQATLNDRWQELNTQAEPEPVINVTIGRVEVRAVQTHFPKQPAAQNKPSGIMSLGDYLEQRNKGRS